MSTEQGMRLRADARRNRDQIIAVAKQVFLDEGTEHPMEEIARRAGVGTGTLYRRFPDRDALMRAVARDNLGALAAEARTAVAEQPSAWDALVRLLEHSRDLRLSLRLSLLSPAACRAAHDDPAAARHRDEILDLLDEIVRGAQAEGALRADVGAGDIAVLGSLLLSRGEFGTDEMRARALSIMLDGLRASPGAPLPGRATGAREAVEGLG
ncbi:TetR/AcrR family transcriptional regulator [Catenuloplanes atrovinosus]|uniref:AcrR family transcriptional regulator n=1 Tax=Catenuloplanes atrovinosus TaxID=137266 RepID=A0AAE3YI32_9ACTN|nr:helix-turn-helix domain-containing protein [Catenuloplanes atrovinosus]MDR7273845.1 AcrR family transcriptional regulator [Catenuloplanes atrovinosus]